MEIHLFLNNITKGSDAMEVIEIINNIGDKFTFYKKLDDGSVLVKTDDERFTLLKVSYEDYINCNVYKPLNTASSRIGLTYLNNKHELMTIVEYNNSADIYVEFIDVYHAKVHTTFNNFKKGEVNNPYRRSYYGVGYLGEGYKPSRGDKTMNCWRNMLNRVYNKNYLDLHPTYLGCSVCDEWLNFQNFYIWYNNNYYEFDDQVMCLDKDILVKGNKIYSPDTVVFVPQFINKLFTKRDNDRGDYPIGITKNHGRYYASCSVYNINTKKVVDVNLGSYNTPTEAFLVYKEAKELNIRKIAEVCKNKIPDKLVQAMMSYTVDIND